jgi:hypothetical protein
LVVEQVVQKVDFNWLVWTQVVSLVFDVLDNVDVTLVGQLGVVKLYELLDHFERKKVVFFVFSVKSEAFRLL